MSMRGFILVIDTVYTMVYSVFTTDFGRVAVSIPVLREFYYK